MKCIKPSYKILIQKNSINDIYKQIEIAGRTCYKSEEKITEDSAKEFVNRMITSGHTAMLEHGTVYLKLNFLAASKEMKIYNKLCKSKYTNIKLYDISGEAYITTNLRVLVEIFPDNWEEILNDYHSEYTKFHNCRISVKFILDRGVSHEFVRHRVFSFAQESTRYCNYSKEKFGEITFILPIWCYNGKENTFEQMFKNTCTKAEQDYLKLIELGYKPQEARAILPTALKTELIMTGFTSDWKHFFDLRALGTTGSPHPQAKELAEQLIKKFMDNKYI